jgi:hypothetical protein
VLFRQAADRLVIHNDDEAALSNEIEPMKVIADRLQDHNRATVLMAEDVRLYLISANKSRPGVVVFERFL